MPPKGSNIRLDPSSNYRRREFISIFTGTLIGSVAIPTIYSGNSQGQSYGKTLETGSTCWLDVCAPFILESEKAGIHSEIILTSDSFFGFNGHANTESSTEYEILLYDELGNPVGENGVAGQLTIPAMQTTVVPVRDLVGKGSDFLGGLVLRLRPSGKW